MKKCPYCARENSEDAVHCRECGTELNPAADPVNDKDDDLVTVLRCPSLMEADLAASRLRAAGIEVFIPEEFAVQTLPWNPAMNAKDGVRLQIEQRDYEAAREVLALPPPPPTPQPAG